MLLWTLTRCVCVFFFFFAGCLGFMILDFGFQTKGLRGLEPIANVVVEQVTFNLLGKHNPYIILIIMKKVNLWFPMIPDK